MPDRAAEATCHDMSIDMTRAAACEQHARRTLALGIASGGSACMYPACRLEPWNRVSGRADPTDTCHEYAHT